MENDDARGDLELKMYLISLQHVQYTHETSNNNLDAIRRCLQELCLVILHQVSKHYIIYLSQKLMFHNCQH